METLRDILVAKLSHILKGMEINKSIPKVVVLKNSRKQNHPLSMERLRKGKRMKFG